MQLFSTAFVPLQFLEDVSLTFIDKSESLDLLKRKDYWKSMLKTMALFGFNIK